MSPRSSRRGEQTGPTKKLWRSTITGTDAAIVFLEDEHDGKVSYRADQGEHITFSLNADLAKAYPRDGVALVGVQQPYEDDQPALEYVARIRKSPNRITTFDRRVRVDDFVGFEPLTLDELRAELPKRFRQHLAPGPLPRRTWEETRAALIRLRPDSEHALRRLEGQPTAQWMQGRFRDVVVLEGDAVRLALRISGIGRSLDWAPPTEPAPFLRGLTNIHVAEENVLDHDMHVFGDWAELDSDVVGVAEFEGGGRRLTIVNVNRRSLERTLGVDLIYYSHVYDGYVLVQYKMLEREGEGEDARFTYRPNRHFSKELERMRSIPRTDWDGSPKAYRLNASAAYLKFCSRYPGRIGNELAPGLYIPLELWDALHASGELTGPKGGFVLNPALLPRHISNTDFQMLVASGWIGSRGKVSQDLRDIIEAGLAGGRSLILAAERFSDVATEDDDELGDDKVLDPM